MITKYTLILSHSLWNLKSCRVLIVLCSVFPPKKFTVVLQYTKFNYTVYKCQYTCTLKVVSSENLGGSKLAPIVGE
jgi:hypothetical protein